MRDRTSALLFSGILTMLAVPAGAQKAYPLPPGSAAQTPAAATSPAPSTTSAPAATPAPAATTSTPVASTSAAQTSATAPESDDQGPPPVRELKGKGKAKKAEYTGPTEIIVLPPTPMLDSEGRQQLDPDGKPMFNPPQKQMRDKKGHPMFDEHGKPIFQTAKDMGYDEHGKKIHGEKEKKPKMVPVHIARGTFSVDGVVGKAALNYDIADLKYMYMYVPGMGVVVVSNETFAGAKEQKAAFNDKILTVTVGDHKLELASDNTLLGKKPEPAFVRLDRDQTLPSRFPVFGWGTLRVPPYQWPGSKPNAVLAGTIAPPPLPKNLQPVLAIQPCPKGQVRVAATKAEAGAVAGQTASAGPCISAALAKEQATQPASHENLGR